MKPMNGSPIIPAADIPAQNSKLRISTQNGMLTIEFEKSVSWVQFNKNDAARFVRGLAEYVKGMK